MDIGLVGTGRMGALHAQVLAAHAGVDRLVLADLDTGRARSVAADLDGVRAGCAVEVIDDPFSIAGAGIDAVVIAAATPAHAPLIEMAAAAGIATFCEKPIALDLETTDRALAAADEAGIYLQMGFNRRFDAGFAAARRAILDGEVGAVRLVRVCTHDPAPPPLAYLRESGGLFRDMHVHDFDAVRFVTGEEVESVYAAGAVLVDGAIGDLGDVDTSALVMRLGSGALVICSGCRQDPLGYDVRLEVLGSRDSLVAGIEDRTPLRSIDEGGLLHGDRGWDFFIDRFAVAYRAQVDAFVENVRSGAPSPCTGHDARAALAIAAAAERSVREGRSVPVSEVAP